jgi:hypothetical protein
LFKGTSIIPTGNTNYALVGLKPGQAAQLGIKGNVNNVPSIDAQATRCQRLVGNPRVTCYANIDRDLMSRVVPWVPYMWAKAVYIIGPNVTRWNFDQSSGYPALAHVAVKS